MSRHMNEIESSIGPSITSYRPRRDASEGERRRLARDVMRSRLTRLSLLRIVADKNRSEGSIERRARYKKRLMSLRFSTIRFQMFNDFNVGPAFTCRANPVALANLKLEPTPSQKDARHGRQAAAQANRRALPHRDQVGGDQAP